MLLFHEHHHHGPGGHEHGHGHGHGHRHGHDHHEHGHDHDHHEHEHEEEEDGKKKKKKHLNLNMKGVFLHVMGDFLGSVVAVVVAVVVWFCHGDWKWYLDPSLSLIVAAVITSSATPLILACVKILMQRVPGGVSTTVLQKHVLEVEGVQSIHDLHVWQLANATNIATVHLYLNEHERSRVMEIVQNVKNVFHKYGIHSTTIQTELGDIPEGQEHDESGISRRCLVHCPTNECVNDTCCRPLLDDFKN